MRFYHNSFMINPKAPSTYSLEPSLKLVMKARKVEHYLAGLSQRIITINIPPLLWAQQRLAKSKGWEKKMGQNGKNRSRVQSFLKSKKRRLWFQIFCALGFLTKASINGHKMKPVGENIDEKCFTEKCKLVCLDNDRRQRERRETKDRAA